MKRLKFLLFNILLLFINSNKFVSESKQSWGYKGVKRLPKSEVDVKSFLFPCSIDEEKYLNSTFGYNHRHLHNCKRKLIIRMTVNSGGEYYSKSDGFIAIDHVIDGITRRKKVLLNPLMIRIKRERMYQIYDLQLVKSVNAEAREEVINYENTANYTGCDTSSSHPTCGFSFFKNKILQFSEGFCCSCDQSKNDQRQPCEIYSIEGKNMPDTALYHRSNRSSRDLEIQSVDKTKTSNDQTADSKSSHSVQYPQVQSDNVNKLEYTPLKNHFQSTNSAIHHDSFISENNLLDETCSDDELMSNPSIDHDIITVRSFHFEHTQQPDHFNNGHPHTMSNFNIVIENGEKEGKNEEEAHKIRAENNSIPQEKLKMLIRNKIKHDKNDEKMMSTVALSSVPDDALKVPNKARSLTVGEDAVRQLPKDGNNTFSLKLASGNSELDIQIVTKQPKEVLSLKPSLDVNNLERQNDKTVNDKNTQTAFKDLISSPESHTSRKSDDPIIINNTNSTSVNNKSNNINIPKRIEHIKKVFVEFMKQKSNSDLDKFLSNTSKNQNANVSFQLEKVTLNNSLPIEVLKSAHTDSNYDSELIKSSSPVEFKNGIVQSSSLSHSEAYHKQKVQKRDTSDKQMRGGQSCSHDGKSLPCAADPETYFESAHCLRYSDLWYNVHKLVNPRIENSITVKIYAKHKTPDRKTCWENLTKRLPGRVGTINEVLVDDRRKIVISYSSDDRVAFSLDCAGDYLLVPQPLPKHCRTEELRTLSSGGPEEYMILKENDITFDGDECDRAGVGYGAFARQPHRCQREAGSCLKNQPLQFWRDDKKALKEGKQGQYFLSNFITVTDQAILQNTSNNQVVLRAPYYKRYQSHIVVELNADHLDIISDKSEGQITEVYIDATSDKVVIVKTVVTNMGISADFFGIDFANCTSRLGPSDFDKPSKDEIPPQHRITYTTTISARVLSKHTECNVILYNVDHEEVASRRIIIVKGHRCMCVWHCQCVCYNHPQPGLLCTPLSLKEYNRAGFPGQLPVETRASTCILMRVLQGVLWFFLLLLLFGLIKAILGLCFASIGFWGLFYILPHDARDMCREPHVVRDCNGFSVYPRTINMLPWYSVFSLNVFFFICLARSCLCDTIYRKASSIMFPYQPYQRMGDCYRATDKYHCSPACSTRCASQCASPCSNRRAFRLAAGGENQILDTNTQAKADEDAKRFVNDLIRSYVVFRNLSRPIGGVQAVPGTPYCVRGFFLELDGGGYQFSPPSPLMQIRQMDDTPLEPPLVLNPAPFRAVYRTVQEVHAARELSPWARGVVINAP